MEQDHIDLNAEQGKIFEGSESNLTPHYDETRAMLYAASWHKPANETRCLAPDCNCESFLHGQSRSSNMLICARSACNHVWSKHDFY